MSCGLNAMLVLKIFCSGKTLKKIQNGEARITNAPSRNREWWRTPVGMNQNITVQFGI